MTAWWEIILVAVVVALAVVWAVRGVWRYLHGDRSCTGCGSEGSCGSGSPRNLVQDLAPLPKARNKETPETSSSD